MNELRQVNQGTLTQRSQRATRLQHSGPQFRLLQLSAHLQRRERPVPESEAGKGGQWKGSEAKEGEGTPTRDHMIPTSKELRSVKRPFSQNHVANIVSASS